MSEAFRKFQLPHASAGTASAKMKRSLMERQEAAPV